MDELSTQEYAQFNDFAGRLRFIPTEHYRRLLKSEAKIILLSTGNQAGKTGSVACSIVDRIMGWHPVAKKNVVYFECSQGHTCAPLYLPSGGACQQCGEVLHIHERGSRVIRCCAETLPGQSQSTNDEGKSAEVKNTQYPELKRWLPPSLIRKDITFRNTSMIVRDPYGGEDIIIEFVSYNQSTQSVAGQQRMLIWPDEAPPIDFYQEQHPRLLAEDGDLIITYTPVDKSSWLFDELFDKARVIYRTQAVIDFFKKQYGRDVQMVEHIDSPYSIEVIQAATDDNPTLKKDVIDELFKNVDDPDDLAIRRYGIFKQLSGRIFKDFTRSIHVRGAAQYFPEGVPHEWVHARGIDYHPQTPWACVMMSISPQNEVFIWGELSMPPEKYTTREIAHELALLGKDYKFRLNLIDPLSEATRKDTVSVFEDLNRAFYQLKKDGVGLGGYWQTWDTKGERGRDSIRERLKKSLVCGRPFNNKVVKDGVTSYLPTLWVLDTCKQVAECMKSWRWEEWASPRDAAVKDKKNTPEQKWSHLNMCIEAVFKEQAFRPPVQLWSEDRTFGADHFKGRGR